MPLVESTVADHNHLAGEAYSAQHAASIINLFENIPDAFPKYSFVFMHPMTSATMILYGITCRNAPLAARHGATLVAAIGFLRLYCQRTWVSGKMIRTVSRLDSLINAAYNQHKDRGKASNSLVSDRGRQYRQQYNSGQDTRPIGPNIVHGEQTALPPSMQAARLNAIGPSPRAQPTSAMLSPVSTGLERTQDYEIQLQNQELRSSPSSRLRREAIEDFTLWSPTAGDAAFVGLPDWATTDFDFEEAFADHGGTGMYNFTSVDSVDFWDGQAQPL